MTIALYAAIVDPAAGDEAQACVVNVTIDVLSRKLILINLAVGKEWGWPSSPDESTVFPAYMYVDYVRAYQSL